MENSESTFVGHGFAITNTTTTPGGATGNAVLLTTANSIGNTLIGNIGDLGGLENNQANYSYNASPDFVIKAAFDPPGKGHYEIFGVVGTARARIFPCATASVALPCINDTTSPSAFGANNDTRTTGGIGVNARNTFFDKHIEVGIHFLGGDGVGRYGTAGNPGRNSPPERHSRADQKLPGVGDARISPVRSWTSTHTSAANMALARLM